MFKLINVEWVCVGFVFDDEGELEVGVVFCILIDGVEDEVGVFVVLCCIYLDFLVGFGVIVFGSCVFELKEWSWILVKELSWYFGV